MKRWELRELRRRAVPMCEKCGRMPAQTGKTLCRKCRDAANAEKRMEYHRRYRPAVPLCSFAKTEMDCLHCPYPDGCILDQGDDYDG